MPAPGKKGGKTASLIGRKSTYDPRRYPGIAASMMRMGATKKDLAEAFGVAESTIYEWSRKFELFSEAIKESAKRANAIVADSLFLAAQDHVVEETRTIYVPDPNTPGTKGKIAKMEVFKRVIPANITAIAMWLNNRDSENWKRNPDGNSADLSKDPLYRLLAEAKDRDVKSDIISETT